MIVKGLWQKVHLICGCHEERVDLVANEKGRTLFYSCPRYYSENRASKEKACSNRITMDDYQYVVEYLGEIIAKNEMNLTIADLTGLEWDKKNVHYRVCQVKNGHYIVSVVNKKSL